MKDNKVKISKLKSYSKWRVSNGQKYLEVHAPDYYALGELLGKNLSKQISGFKYLIKMYGKRYINRKITYKKLLNYSEEYITSIPEYFHAEMMGMAEAIKGINYIDILLQNCFIDILYGNLIPNDKLEKNNYGIFDFGCTLIGVMNNGIPLLGQNFDLSIGYKPLTSFVHLITPKGNHIFTLRLGGLLTLPIGMNDYGVSTRVSMVKSQCSGISNMPISIRFRALLEESRTASIFSKEIIKNNNNSFNLLVADKTDLIAMEILPKHHQKYDVKKSVICTNTFNLETFQKYLIDPNYSKKRQNYAETLLRDLLLLSSKNELLDDKDLLKIMADLPKICLVNIFKPMTIAFLTNSFFGLGNPQKNAPGIVPQI